MSDLRARIERMTSVLEEHLLTGPAPGQCRCGWGQEPAHLGKSHAKHVARMLDAALPEADRDEVADVIYDETDAAIRGHEITSDLQWPDAQAAADALLSRYHLIPKEDS